MRMSRKGLMTAVVVVSSACAGVLASAVQASPAGSQGLVPTVWDCFDGGFQVGNEYTADVSLPAAFNAPVTGGRTTRSFPGIVTKLIPKNSGEPTLPLGPYHVFPAASPPNKNGIVNGTQLTCTLTNPPVVPPVVLTAAYAGG